MILKNKNIWILTLIFVAILLQSCFKEDEKLPPYVPGDVETMITNMGETYYEQIFVDLNTYSEKSSNSINIWDLAFECKDGAWHVLLNSSLTMYIGNTNDTNFAAVNSDAGLDMIFDVSSGNLDSTAIGEWYYLEADQLISKKSTYVVNRGIDSDFQELGFAKIQLDFQDGNYVLRHANLDGTNEQKVVLAKNPDYNYIFYSFDNGQLAIEPPKNQWSLKFTRYSTILFTDVGDAYPYNVVGVLLNPHQVMVSKNTDDFTSISLQDTARYEYSSQADRIGYDWKIYNFDDGLYTVVPDVNFVIRNYDGFYYKMRFVAFYDEFGHKGAITYEVKRL